MQMPKIFASAQRWMLRWYLSLTSGLVNPSPLHWNIAFNYLICSLLSTCLEREVCV